MAGEPIEVEVLTQDETSLVRPQPRVISPLKPAINVLALIFAVLTAAMLLVLATAAVVFQQARGKNDQHPNEE